MNANELMIGDWVYSPWHKPTRIKAIDNDSVLYFEFERFSYAAAICINPIPMTPEILEKNGWMYVDKDRAFLGAKLEGELPWISYATDGRNEVFRLRDFCDLQYIHQLQHALRLCNITKEIEL